MITLVFSLLVSNKTHLLQRLKTWYQIRKVMSSGGFIMSGAPYRHHPGIASLMNALGHC